MPVLNEHRTRLHKMSTTAPLAVHALTVLGRGGETALLTGRWRSAGQRASPAAIRAPAGLVF